MTIKTIFLLALSCFVTRFSYSQTKRALIVAIGNYPNPVKNRWKVIDSENDIPLIKNALVINQQFNENNIRVLVDSQATKKGIVDALDELIATSNKGDIVVIHFSSHGEQIEDDNNDEMDGLDETIVPYGAVFSSDPEKFAQDTSGYLRDDLFGEKATQLRNKLGRAGDLLVILDACHSGSGTRGVETAKIRGGNIPMVSNNFNAKKFSNIADTGVFKENLGTRLDADAATYVLISGAQAQENNYECYDDNNNAVGSLSYSFSKSISSLKGTITYRGLFALIENIMRDKAPNQKPVLEGDGIDRELFGGKYEKQQLYFSISTSQSTNDQVVLNAGFVSGITKGSEINFFEPGTTNTAGKKPVSTGKVTSVSSFTSTVKPDSAADKLLKMNAWAFINELSYGTGRLKLFVKDNKEIAGMVKDSLKDFQLIEFNQTCDLFLDTSGSVNNWALKYPNSDKIFQDGFTFSGNDMHRLKEALKNFSRFRYLKGLTFSETGLSANIQLVFLDNKGNIDSAKLRSRTDLGRLELREGDQVYLRIINTGDKDFYINIVDIQPDAGIGPVIPNKKVKDKNNADAPIKWEDCLVKIHDTLFLRNLSIGISKPYGEETFKVFLSSSPIDLEDILTSTDGGEVKSQKGILSELEKVFVNSTIKENGTRGVDLVKVNADESGTVFSLNFRILPK